MKAGAENRKKTIMAGALVAVALCCIFYAYNALFSGTSAAPPPTVAPIAAPARTSAAPSQTAVTTAANQGRTASIAGVDAVKLAHTSASLDPTLDETAMHRAESLVYSGSGRNIFSLISTPPPVILPSHVPPPRPKPTPIILPPAPVGPPPPPPIDLKFFGTARRSNGLVQAFLLQGDNVYLASTGEIVAHKYKIVAINLNSIQVEDLQNNNTQTLPLLMQ